MSQLSFFLLPLVCSVLYLPTSVCCRLELPFLALFISCLSQENNWHQVARLLWEINNSSYSQATPPHFIATKLFLPCSQGPATGPCPETDESNHVPQTIIVEVKIHCPCARYEGVWGSGFLTFSLDGREWSASLPGRFTPGKDPRYPLYRRVGGLRSWS